jgi:YHS domain-containing protein
MAILACLAALAPRTACAQITPKLAPHLAPQLAARTNTGPFPQRETLPVLPLAAEGYCVTSLHDQQQWLRGDERFAAQFDGRQYVFAGARERDIFAAAPIVYAPVLSGDCVVTFAETGKRVPGSVKFGVVQGGRIYFFAGNEQRAAFVAAPARYADADLADGGRCLVTRVDERRDLPGLPETAVLSGGLRRLFAGAHQQSLFLQHPERYGAASATAPPSGQMAAGGGGWRPLSPTPDLAPGAAPATGDGANSDSGASASDAAKNAASQDREAREIPLTPDPAMGGFCPVSIREKGTWVRGRYDFRVEVDKLVFFTAGPAEHDLFLANPTKYIPANGGDCAVSLVDYGEHVRGSIFHAAEYPAHNARLFLFADAERKAAFKAGPERYASIDLAANGDCVVTITDEKRQQPGFAEFAAWHGGLLYRFAGAEQLAKFLATPEKYEVKEGTQ